MKLDYLPVIIVIPSKRDSRRLSGKNNSHFWAGMSLTEISCTSGLEIREGLSSGVEDTSTVVLVSSHPSSDTQKEVVSYSYPKWYIDGYCNEVDNSVQIWGYAIRRAMESGAVFSTTVLLEPSSFPRNTKLIIESIRSFDGRTTVAIAPYHRWGMKAHVMAPTGEFYIARSESVLDGYVFDGDLRYIFSDSINIDTEEDLYDAKKIAMTMSWGGR